MVAFNWLQVIVPFCSGGAVGAVLTALITTYRNRIQPVALAQSITPVFRPTTEADQLGVEILVPLSVDKTRLKSYKNLFLAEITVMNSGNRDLPEFDFGLTLGENDSCIMVDSKSQDRHHAVQYLNRPTPEAPNQFLDLALKPFNRKDRYTIKLYIVVGDKHPEPCEIRISSKLPVKFSESPAFGDALMQALKIAVQTKVGFKVYPF